MFERSLRTGPLSETEQHGDNTKQYSRCLRAGRKAGEVLHQLEKIPPPPEKRNDTTRHNTTHRFDVTRPNPTQPVPGRVAPLTTFLQQLFHFIHSGISATGIVLIYRQSHMIYLKVSLCHCIIFTCDALLNGTSKDNICPLK